MTQLRELKHGILNRCGNQVGKILSGTCLGLEEEIATKASELSSSPQATRKQQQWRAASLKETVLLMVVLVNLIHVYIKHMSYLPFHIHT